MSLHPRPLMHKHDSLILLFPSPDLTIAMSVLASRRLRHGSALRPVSTPQRLNAKHRCLILSSEPHNGSHLVGRRSRQRRQRQRLRTGER